MGKFEATIPGAEKKWRLHNILHLKTKSTFASQKTKNIMCLDVFRMWCLLVRILYAFKNRTLT